MSQLRDSSDGDNAGSKKKAVHQNRKRIGTLTGASWSWRIVGCTSPPQNLFPFPLRLGPIVLAYSSGTSPHLAKQMSRLSNMNPGDDLSQGLEKQVLVQVLPCAPYSIYSIHSIHPYLYNIALTRYSTLHFPYSLVGMCSPSSIRLQHTTGW